MAILKITRKTETDSRVDFGVKEEPEDYYHLELKISGELISKDDYHDLARHLRGIRKVFEKLKKL